LREEQTARLIEGLRDHELDAAILALPYEANGIEMKLCHLPMMSFYSLRQKITNWQSKTL